MNAIYYKDGVIHIVSENNECILTKIYQIYLASELFEMYRNNSEDEEAFQMYTVMLDCLNIAKEQFIRNCEETCIKNSLSIL